MENLVNIGVRAARRAGELIIRHMDRIDTMHIAEKQINDFVTEVDRKAELTIIDIIHKSFPDHAILGEETGASGDNEVVWIIDPIDGTTNFIHGFPTFAVSIGVQVRGQMEAAIVYDPCRQELFTASRGNGAKMDDRRLRVSKQMDLRGALIGTGFPFRDFSNLENYMGMFRNIMVKTAGIRRPGAASLDLAYVAAGRLDGFWEMGLKPWDIAAGSLLIQEAGGIITDFAGGKAFLESGNVLTGSYKLHAALHKEIAPFVAGLK